ncbi:MAG: ferrochelatase [Methylococcaceae bacterium]|nr:ferrochelatase [Methylococcaceae bacterium]
MINSTTHSPAGYLRPDEIPPEKVGVLLVNLGTPDAPNANSVRRYLAEFLSDRRVIELHPFLWKPLLHGFVLPLRCERVARAYRKIWFHETDESPLRYFTRRQAELLGERFKQLNRELIVDWAMRYGRPSIPATLDGLRKRGCRRILVAPLYPHYSATTTATVIDKLNESMQTMRYQPALRTLPPYYDRAVFIETLVSSVKQYLESKANKPDVLIASYHGLPQAYVDAGDPYYSHCAITTRLLREGLRVDERFLRMSFQSRFGPKQWLRPYTDQTLIELANSGIRNVALFTPGFAADCLETLEEIGMQNRDLFLAHGGRSYEYIPCLNDSPEAIEMLVYMIEQELAGWL